MKEYLERILHQDIQLSDYKEINKLPLACRNTCELQVMRIGNQECILAVPFEALNLTELRKQQRLLERFSGHYCALYLSNMNYYAKDKMIEEGIPFVWENHQIYLPFLGILLNQNDGRNPRNCEQISFLTQKLILIAIYENWKGVTVTQAAERLGVSNMSVTRCFDEIQVLGLPYLKIKNRARKFYCDENKMKMWEQLRPVFRNPVIAEFRLSESIDGNYFMAGTSALSAYSMLCEDSCPTYAVLKTQIAGLKDKLKAVVPKGEEPACVVQEVGYMIPFQNENALDPLSLVLTLKESEMNDPRVEIAVNEMLEEYVW